MVRLRASRASAVADLLALGALALASATAKLGTGEVSSTIEVQAVNIPVDVKPPSPRKTISEKQFERLLRERCGRRPSGKAAASIQGGFTIESC